MAIKDLETIYRGKKVLITGHTGFKGSWLTLWLSQLGANVYGYALDPPTDPSLFALLRLQELIEHQVADIRNREQLRRTVARIKPDIIFHLAAQSLVKDSYNDPIETVEVNTMGTINLMEVVRHARLSTAMVMVTSDKCYENREWLYGYRENDPLGGHDPYSASKAGAELFINSWRQSFFPTGFVLDHGVRLASARAGNVVGGGDWTRHNIVPDCIRALQRGEPIEVRSPLATRPWQHVLEALGGYLALGGKLLSSDQSRVADYCTAFNFGPRVESNRKVQELVETVISCWGSGSWKDASSQGAPHEASLLNIAIDKAYHLLGWSPKLDFEESIHQTIEWHKRLQMDEENLRDFTVNQIRRYTDGIVNVAALSPAVALT